MEVDEVPRARARFNLDREAREQMSEGLEVWIPNDATSSLRSLETQPVRPLMDVVLPGYTPTSTSSDSQVSGGSSRLKELGEKLRQKSRESSARPELPPTWREQPVRSVVISSYKKNTEKRYHRHNRLDCSAEQKARRDCFHDAAWVEYLAPPRVPEGAVHLIIGDSLVRVLTRIQSHWQTGILSFAGAATPQMLATLEMLGMTKMYTVTLMIGTNDVSRREARKITRLHDKMSCLLEELRIQMDPILLTVCTVPYNMMFDQHALEMNEKVRNLNKVIRDIHRKSVLPVRLLDVAERMEKKGFPEDTSNDGIHFDRPRGAEWLNDVFQEHINTLEADLLETAQFTLGPPPNPPFLASRALSGRLGPRDDLSEIWGEELLKLESENASDHERQNVIGKPVGGAPNMEDNDTMHEKMIELEPLLEASGERNLRSIEITHGECPCHCLAQTVWYPDHKNLCLVWDMEEIRSIGLPDHRQKVTLLVVSTMLALRWIEENITKYREATTPTAESIYAIDYSRRLELFETACKVFAIPTEVRHVWSRLRYFPWFRATLTSWLYMTTKNHMRKHQKEYRQFQAEIGPEAFKRPLLTHRNAITTGWKRVGKMSRDNTKARESILEEDLAKNVSLSLHNSFCLNRESRVKALPNQAKRLQEQREWMRSYEQLKAWEEIVISSDDEEELLRQFAVSSTSGCGTSKAKSAR